MKDDFDLLDEQPGPKRNYVAIVIRRRWYVIAPLLLCGLAGSVIAQFWPLLYRSDAFILVEQQRVPEQYVMPNVITNLQDRLDAMTQQIESRTRLQALIEEVGLYKKERARYGIDDLVDKMRKNIGVTLVQGTSRQGGVTGFRISFAADNASVAQRITEQLTTLFIDQSMRERTQQSTGTTQFLQSELDGAQKDLADQEQRLREYKLKFIGELPEQQQGNLQLLSSAEAQLYAAEGALQRAEQQKTYLEAMSAEYMAIAAPVVAPDGTVIQPSDTVRSSVQMQVDAAIQATEKELDELRAVYKPTWPRIKQLEADLVFWQGKQKALQAAASEKAASSRTTGTAAPSPISNAARLSMAELDSRLKSSVLEIQGLKEDQSQLKGRIDELQKRVNLTPLREQQLSEITRSYENTRAQYQSLLQKKVQSELASNLDKKQQGEQFRILDPASLPKKPEGRMAILGAGWFIGLCLGLGLLTVCELATQSVTDDADVKSLVPCPVFQIPVIRTKSEESRDRLKFAVESLVAVSLVLAAAAATARTYLMG